MVWKIMDIIILKNILKVPIFLYQKMRLNKIINELRIKNILKVLKWKPEFCLKQKIISNGILIIQWSLWSRETS